MKRCAGLFVVLCLTALPARAELVFFSTGRSMSVRTHRVEGDQIVLLPRDGGEVTMSLGLITRIEPDEVPYPESATEFAPEPFDPATLATFSVQSAHEYDPIIERVAAEQGVDAKLVKAMIQVESNYQERARSPKGAMGLMQLMPETARQYSVANPYDAASNIEGGIKYLKSLLDRYPVRLALAAYNAGAATVDRFRGVPPYQETRDYVARILQIAAR
ncbi:MAG TPA: lytic transglycosylase domain-containing protein [Vicinamibacterales bacterium]|jgi:soluble lytic murein transglycosylase-like protein|nr:lytic transglycosylase domain-containing protein [Vicinamibacterales bacterium]